MRTCRLGSAMLVLAALTVFAMATAGPTGAQSDQELKALDERISELRLAGKYGEAIPLAERYAEAVRSRHGANAIEYALALMSLAWVLQDADRRVEVEPLYRHALAIAEKSLGSDDPRVIDLLHNLANRIELTGWRAEAVLLWRRVLAMAERTLGPDHPIVARQLTTLAVFLEDANEAEQLMHRAVAIEEKNFGPDHPSVAGRLNTLAILLQMRNRLAEAESLLRRAFAIDEKGSDHGALTNTLANLHRVLRLAGRSADAEPLIRRALAFYETHVGPDDALGASWLTQWRHLLLRLLVDTGRHAEAEELDRSWARK